ncbi:hypothetical protein XENOCAPTIV_020252, partial [Xenoophorus captivus]
MMKGSGGYGFNLHSEKNKPGQYIRAVDNDSPAHKAGLRPQDKIIQLSCRYAQEHVVLISASYQSLLAWSTLTGL